MSHVKGILVQTAQGWFCLDPNDQVVSKCLIDSGAYGLREIETAKRFLNASSKILLVGAHVGTIAVPISKLCRELVAIEANPDTYQLLALNLLLNRCSNVASHAVAANDEDAPLSFVMNTHNSGGSKRMPKVRSKMYFYDNPKVTVVQGVRLDDYLNDHDFDLVFMDIEGSEYFAFLGMQDIFAHAKALIVEFLPHHLIQVAGVTVEQFLAPLMPHFRSLTIPGMGRIASDSFLRVLQAMVEQERGEPAIIFEK